MKKILYAIMGAALLLFAGCEEKGEVFYQNPYRIIVDYQPSTFTISGLSGNVTPDGDYNWITSNGNGSFTVRRNTSGVIRRAEFTVAGSKDKAIVNQRAHGLDATVTPALKGQGLGSATINVTLATKFIDDYAGWGLIYNTANDRAAGKVVPQSGAPVAGINLGEITGLAEGTDYYAWAYVEDTEGLRVYSGPIGIVPPIYVKAGENLQAAIDGAKEFQEIRVAGGATFPGPVVFDDKNKNKSISGGWNADFTEQSMDNLTIIDGAGVNRGFYCGEDPLTDMPLKGSVEISYFEIQNCLSMSGHGSAIRVSGGPIKIHHCYMHDNVTDRGTIATREDDQSSDIEIYNCILTNNIAHGHAPGISIEDGKDYYGMETHAVIANCLIANNFSDKEDGYAGSIYLYNKIIAKVFNNTLVGNINYDENNGNLWPSFTIRQWGKIHLANNIIVGNRSRKQGGTENVLQDYEVNCGGNDGMQVVNNLVEGGFASTGGCVLSGNTVLPAGFDLKEIFRDPANGDYTPVGKAVGAGTLDPIVMTSTWDNVSETLDIRAMMEKYETDLKGNPRITNGKIDVGCIQAQ